MASLDARVDRLEERRQQEAIATIFERTRAATLEGMALFISEGFELREKPEPDEEEEQRLWGHLNVPLEAVRIAEAAPPGQQWAVALGDMLHERRGLREHLRKHHPKTAARLYRQPGADEASS